jgi:hypothetical protein
MKTPRMSDMKGDLKGRAEGIAEEGFWGRRVSESMTQRANLLHYKARG